MLGCDTNQKLSAGDVKNLFAIGYKFVIRYVGRYAQAKYDLNLEEVKTIIDGGLKLAVVQHCESGWWSTSEEKGKIYGINAGEFAKQAGVKQGTSIYLDLECLAKVNSIQSVIGYCNNWYDEVVQYYTPGIYIGYQVLLNANQLSNALKFKHYWGAYNADVAPIRGFEMQQKPEKNIFGIQIDDNIVLGDKLGNKPIFMGKETENVNWKNIIDKVSATPEDAELWKKSIETIIAAADAPGDMGQAFERLHWLPTLIEKIWNGREL